MNITSQNTRFASTRVGLTCVPERSTACITPPRSSSWFKPNASQPALDELLEHLREQIAGEENDQRAEQRGQRLAEDLREARLQTVAEVRACLVVA